MENFSFYRSQRSQAAVGRRDNGVLEQCSLKLQEGIFLNVDTCPCTDAPRYM